jgi:DNA-binding NarL/FixJ family response regulator
MARAKAQGKHIARPALALELQRQIIELLGQGLSLNKINKQLGIAYGTVYNYARKSKQ